jgi:hypothetical protein
MAINRNKKNIYYQTIKNKSRIISSNFIQQNTFLISIETILTKKSRPKSAFFVRLLFIKLPHRGEHFLECKDVLPE